MNTVRSPMKWIFGVFIIGIFGAISLAVDNAWWSDAIQNFLGERIFEITYQFFLITTIGGALAAFYKSLQSAAQNKEMRFSALRQKNEMRFDALRERQKEIDGLYRDIKKVKRNLRARLDGISEKKSFRADIIIGELEDLHDAQLSIENLREVTRSNSYLIDDEDIREKVGDCLEYVGAYIHDVYEDFEKQRGIEFDGDNLTIDRRAKNLFRFIEHDRHPKQKTSSLKDNNGKKIGNIENNWEHLKKFVFEKRLYYNIARYCIGCSRYIIDDYIADQMRKFEDEGVNY